MDTAHPERQLIDTALLAMRANGVNGRFLEGPRDHERHDGKVELSTNNQASRRYLVEVKRHVSMSTVAAISAQMRITKANLLIAQYIGPDVADWLRAEKIQFADTAGNAFLQTPGTLIWVKGNRPVRDEQSELKAVLRKQVAARAFEPAGLRILFAFLCDPSLVNRPYREIAEKAGVAHGSVGWVMGELPHRGFLYDFGPDKGGRKLRRIDELLAEWAAAYARRLRPSLVLGRFRSNDPNWWTHFHPRIYHALLGSEPAAAKVTKHLRPEVITLYVHKIEPRLLVDHALRADPNGNVEIAQRFWNFDTVEAEEGLTPLPLIYADLLATGDPRSIETADLVRERFLAAQSR
jgi:hypothetical protein